VSKDGENRLLNNDASCSCVDKTATLLKQIGATIVRGQLGAGYYYVLFEDPDGIRLEVNHVPGAGVLADGVSFNPTEGGYR
jgi:hypothetical protein